MTPDELAELPVGFYMATMNFGNNGGHVMIGHQVMKCVKLPLNRWHMFNDVDSIEYTKSEMAGLAVKMELVHKF